MKTVPCPTLSFTPAQRKTRETDFAVTLAPPMRESCRGIQLLLLGCAAILGNFAWAAAVEAGSLEGTDVGPHGPEAGVWVIAETHDLPTKFVKIVVTDDEGRYVLPELPAAHYDVWVRGYGLVDSPKTPASPGKTLNLMAVLAPNPQAAAHYYP